jgi:hypothetical protein
MLNLSQRIIPPNSSPDLVFEYSLTVPGEVFSEAFKSVKQLQLLTDEEWASTFVPPANR